MGVGDDKTISAGSLTPNSEEDLPVGMHVGEYVIEQKIGEGGFGAVYRATHPLIGKTAAVKVLNREFSSNQEMVSRFVAEARAVNQIRHRNIIDIFAFGGLPDGRQYYIMELLEGQPFDQYLEKVKRLDLATALPIFRGIARALDAAHKSGIVHRDLKPENVFLVPNDDGGMAPKLLDFGIAKLLPGGKGDSGMQQQKTRTGTQIGTPYYMSPEQCRGIGVDHRTDIYAFGVMLHRVLSGILPFDGESVMDVMMKHITTAPPSLTTYGFPAPLSDAVAKLMAKNADERPQGALEAIEAVQAAAAGGNFSATLAPNTQPSVQASTAIATTDLGMSAMTPQPKRSAAPLIIAVVVLIGIGAGGLALMMRPPPPAPPPVTVTSTPTPTATPTPAPTPTPTNPKQIETATAATSVKVKLETVPKATEIFIGEKKIGVAPGPIELPAEEVELTIKAPGFAPKIIKLTPKDGETIKATLAPAGKVKPVGTLHKDLDSPFK